jgi:hypothetical protein
VVFGSWDVECEKPQSKKSTKATENISHFRKEIAMTKNWLESRQVQVAYGLSSDQAAVVLESAPGDWWIKVYHRCSEAPVAILKDEQNLEEDWVCPACEMAIEDIAIELTFERMKILPEGLDRNQFVVECVQSLALKLEKP